MTTKYVARLNGKIVGKRTTKSRAYTHAIVVQRLEDVCRNDAYNRGAAWVAQDRKNFAYYAEKAAAGVSHRHYWGTDAEKAEAHAKDAATAAGGVDAYIELQRQLEINRFHECQKTGYFEPFVAAWAGRLDLAQKAVGQHTGRAVKLVAIVPAEEV